MATDLSRRSFLRGTYEEENLTVMRPPGAQNDLFQDMCTRCGDCIKSCPETVISIDDSGLPVLDFSDGHCTFCGACAEACPTDALILTEVCASEWRAKVEPTCWSMNAITCRMCQDACDMSAIRFQLMTGGRASPLIDLDACNGCGACSTVCPAEAISFFEDPQATRDEDPQATRDDVA